MHSILFSTLCLRFLTFFAHCVSVSHSAVHTALDRLTLSIKQPYFPPPSTPAVPVTQPSDSASARVTSSITPLTTQETRSVLLGPPTCGSGALLPKSGRKRQLVTYFTQVAQFFFRPRLGKSDRGLRQNLCKNKLHFGHCPFFSILGLNG
jgi:hypothetical protein